MQFDSRSAGAVLAGMLIVHLSAFSAVAGTAVVWDGTAGGTGPDSLFGLSAVAAGGTIVVGQSSSPVSGNKVATPFGGSDFWTVRYDAQGNKLWDRTYGGSGEDGAFSVTQADNGGFLIAGYSESGISGNKTGTNYGRRDFWIVRTDAEGGKVWDRTFGGSRDETAFCIIRCSGGGSLCGGESSSVPGGTKTSPAYGGTDVWLVRLDASGAKLWEKSYGGSGDDVCYAICQTQDNGFLVAGSSTSGPDGTKSSAAFGGTDVWLLRLDSGGNKVWDATFGGTGDEAYNSVSVVIAPDGSYVVATDSTSVPGGNKTSPAFGLEDYWLVGVGQTGEKLWEQSYGGTGSDYPTSIQAAPSGGFLVAGGSDSQKTGNKTVASFGLVDAWLVKVTASGEKVWDQAFGGAGEDGFYNVSVAVNSDGSLFLGADSTSGPNGNKSSPAYGSRDFWVLKLQESIPSLLRPDSASNLAGPGFRFFLSGQSGLSYRTEYSTNLAYWIPFSTNKVMDGWVGIVDPTSSNSPARCYRAVELRSVAFD